MKAMFLAAATIIVGSGAAAQDADIEAGGAYAEQVCSACHAVLAKETYSPLPEATSFQQVADTPGMRSPSSCKARTPLCPTSFSSRTTCAMYAV
jgi:hypothetical protein